MNNYPCNILELLNEDREQRFNSEIDIIVVSCARYRLNDKNYYSLTDTNLLKEITLEDYEKAKAIRKHYGELLICEQLKGNNLSEFRKELALILATDGSTYKKNWTGILYKLPYFYDYDCQIKELKETVFIGSQNHSPSSEKTFAILKPVKRLFRNVKHNNKYSYFFEIEDTGVAAKIHISKDNPMIDMWEQLFEQKKPMHITGDFIWGKDQNLYSYLIKNFKILNLHLG